MAGSVGGISGLSCSVCYNSYNTSEENNIPRSLSCGHTYCTGCLEKLISERNDAVIIKCPTCKRETVLLTPQPGGSRNLPKNFGLLEIVSIYENNEGKQTSGTHEPSQSSHSNDKPICKEHDEPMKVYCHTDKYLICIYCQVYGDHVGHDCQLACQLVKERRETVEKLYKKLKECLQNIILAKINHGQTITRIRQRADSLQERISEHFKYLHHELDKREKCLTRRLHTKSEEQAMAVLSQERMWSTLIIKGHELRERCCKVLRSTDYSILTEEKSICDSVDGLATLIANSELCPFPSCKLTWACEEELTDAIRFHGHIIEEADSSGSQCLFSNDEVLNKPDDEVLDEIIESVERMFDSNSSDQAVAGPNDQNDLEEEDELEEEEEDLDNEEGEEITGAVGRDQSHQKPKHNNLINELRSEIGREIQRLEMIYLPVASQVLSDSSSEDNEVQTVDDETRRPDTEDYNERKDIALLPRMTTMLQGEDQSERPESQEEERPQQQEQDQQQWYRQQHHHHHRARQRHHHPTPYGPCGCCTCQQPRGIALYDVCEACLRSKCTKRSEYSPRSHRQRGNHSRSIDVHDNEDRNHDICGTCHMPVKDTDQEVCSKCHGHAGTTHSMTVANCDNICPMCTLANETGKSRCELCGFHLPV